MKLNSFKDFYTEELRDIYDALEATDPQNDISEAVVSVLEAAGD